MLEVRCESVVEPRDKLLEPTYVMVLLLQASLSGLAQPLSVLSVLSVYKVDKQSVE